MMTPEKIKDIHTIQSRNVRHLKKVQKNINMDINHSLLKGDDFKVQLKTKLYSLLFSALSESQFTQILYTPNGFMYSEILNIQEEGAIFNQWYLMLDIALNKVGNYEQNADLKNKRNQLREIIKEYIEEPQILRNKIAHGQWLHALNRKDTKENVDISNKIANLNIVEISKWFDIHQYLCFIIRDLVQSPHKGFHNNYWVNYTALETFLAHSKDWSLEKRVEDIKRKFKNKANQNRPA